MRIYRLKRVKARIRPKRTGNIDPEIREFYHKYLTGEPKTIVWKKWSEFEKKSPKQEEVGEWIETSLKDPFSDKKMFYCSRCAAFDTGRSQFCRRCGVRMKNSYDYKTDLE